MFNLMRKQNNTLPFCKYENETCIRFIPVLGALGKASNQQVYKYIIKKMARVSD